MRVLILGCSFSFGHYGPLEDNDNDGPKGQYNKGEKWYGPEGWYNYIDILKNVKVDIFALPGCGYFNYAEIIAKLEHEDKLKLYTHVIIQETIEPRIKFFSSGRVLLDEFFKKIEMGNFTLYNENMSWIKKPQKDHLIYDHYIDRFELILKKYNIKINSGMKEWILDCYDSIVRPGFLTELSITFLEKKLKNKKGLVFATGPPDSKFMWKQENLIRLPLYRINNILRNEDANLITVKPDGNTGHYTHKGCKYLANILNKLIKENT